LLQPPCCYSCSAQLWRNRAPRLQGCDVPEVVDRVDAISEDGEIRLGRLGAVRIADIRLPDGNEAARPLAWLRSLTGREVRVSAGQPDRWQRRRAALLLTDDVPPIDVGELLIAEGFALVDPGEEDTLCRSNLLAVETRARERRLGVWKTDGGPALKAEDAAAINNFGRVGTNALTVTLPKRTWSMLRARGITADARPKSSSARHRRDVARGHDGGGRPRTS